MCWPEKQQIFVRHLADKYNHEQSWKDREEHRKLAIAVHFEIFSGRKEETRFRRRISELLHSTFVPWWMSIGSEGQLLHYQAVMSSQPRNARSKAAVGPQKLPSPRAARETKLGSPRAATALHRQPRRVTQQFRQSRRNMPSTFISDIVPTRYISPPRSPPPSTNRKRYWDTYPNKMTETSGLFCVWLSHTCSFPQVPEIVGGYKAGITFIWTSSGNAKKACSNSEIKMRAIASKFGKSHLLNNLRAYVSIWLFFPIVHWCIAHTRLQCQLCN